jgi:hypothetical protein
MADKTKPAKVAEEETEPQAGLYYEQVNNITFVAEQGSTVNIHINQSGEPKNEPPKGGGG